MSYPERKASLFDMAASYRHGSHICCIEKTAVLTA